MFRLLVLFATLPLLLYGQHIFTPLHKGDVIAIHTSAYTSPVNLPHIPLAQSVPPDCPPSPHPWIKPDTGYRVMTNSDYRTALTMFRRGANHTLGQLLLGHNLQVSSMFLVVGEEQRLEVACDIKITDSLETCETLEQLHELHAKSVWYVDGVPSLYTPLEREYVDRSHLGGIDDDSQNPSFLEELFNDLRREANRDMDSFEIGFPAVPQDQPMPEYMVVWTHYHFRIYYRPHREMGHANEEIYEIVGFEVVPSRPKYLWCGEESHKKYNVTYSTDWIVTLMSATTRNNVYLFHYKHFVDIQIGGIFFAIFITILFAFIGLTWLRSVIHAENRQLSDPANNDIYMGGWRAMAGDVFRIPIYANLWAAFMGVGAECLCIITILTIAIILTAFYIDSVTSLVEIAIFATSASHLLNGMFAVAWLRMIDRKLISEPGTITDVQDGANVITITKITDVNQVAKPFGFGFVISTVSLGAMFFVQQHLVSQHDSTAFLGWVDAVSGYAMWLTMAMMFQIIGGIVGWTISSSVPRLSCTINNIPRAVMIEPVKRWGMISIGMGLTVGCLFAGVSVFVTIFKSTWGAYVQAMYGVTALAVYVYFAICIVSTLLFVFQMIRWEEYRWWWRAPIMGGFSSIVLFFGMTLFVYGFSQVYDDVGRLLMVLETFMVCWTVFFALFFMTGSCAFFFVQYLYKNVKAD